MDIGNWNIRSIVRFYVVNSLFFLIDVCLFSLFSCPIIYLVLYSSIVSAVAHVNVVYLLSLGLLLWLESFLYTGQLAVTVGYFCALLAGALYIRRAFYPDRTLFLSLSIGCLLVQTLIIEVFLLPMQAINYYTFLKIAVNMILIGLFSLKLRFQGGRGNRCLG